MGEYRYQLRHSVSSYQCIEQGDSLVSAESCEEGVRLRGAPGAVDDEDVCYREIYRTGIVQNGFSQFTLFQRSEPAEERHDPVRSYVLQRQREQAKGDPAVYPGVVACELKQGKNAAQQRSSDQHGEENPLELVHHESAPCSPVEAEALLNDKRAVDGEGKPDQTVAHSQNADVEKPVDNGSEAQGPDCLVKMVESPGKPEGKHDGEANGAGYEVETGVGAEVLLGPAVIVRLVYPF